jgi:hypothetical protein
MDDSPLRLEGGPDLLREGKVGGVVAVQVTDLPPAELEGELSASARACLDARPGRDLLDDLLARCLCLVH